MTWREKLSNLKWQLKAQWEVGAEEGRRLKKEHKNYIKDKIKKEK